MTPHAWLTSNSCDRDSTRIVLPHYYKYIIKFKGAALKKFTIFAYENRSYLGEFYAEFKKALFHESEGIVW
jgi:hypothetical protein